MRSELLHEIWLRGRTCGDERVHGSPHARHERTKAPSFDEMGYVAFGLGVLAPRNGRFGCDEMLAELETRQEGYATQKGKTTRTSRKDRTITGRVPKVGIAILSRDSRVSPSSSALPFVSPDGKGRLRRRAAVLGAPMGRAGLQPFVTSGESRRPAGTVRLGVCGCFPT
jgi:hypothetical protein